MRMRHIAISVACAALQFFSLINGTIFEKKKRCLAQNVRFDFLYNFCLNHFSF